MQERELEFQGVCPQKTVVILRRSLKANGYELEGTCATGLIVASLEGVRIFSAIKYGGGAWSVLAVPGLLLMEDGSDAPSLAERNGL